MDILEEFYKLQKENLLKFKQYLNAGKTYTEIFKLLKPELDKIANYVKIHQTELLDTLDDSMKELISKHNIDPMLILILSTMYLTGPIFHTD